MNPIERAVGPALESLEPRLLLSGVVAVQVTSLHVLQITGDSASNQITIEQTGLGAFTIRGESGTQIKLGASGSPAGSQAVAGATGDWVINMGGGAEDMVKAASDLHVGNVDPVTAKGTRASINYTGGAGNDTLWLAGESATGTLTFTGIPSVGDTLDFAGAMDQAETFEFILNPGDAVSGENVGVVRGDTPAESLANFIEAFQDSNLAIRVTDTSSGAAVSCSFLATPGSAWNYEIVSSNPAVIGADGMDGGTDFLVDAQNVSASMGGGENMFAYGNADGVDMPTSRIFGNLTATGGTGEDTIIVTGTVVAGNATVSPGGGTGGSCNNTVILVGTGVNGTFTVTGAPAPSTADDDVTAIDCDLGGNVTVNLYGGDNYFDAAESSIEGNVTYTGTGSTGDWLNMDDIEIVGNLLVTTGSFWDEVDLEPSQITGNVTLTLGDWGGEVDFGEATIFGNVAVTAGAGSDWIRLGGAVIVGNVQFTLGAGDNRLNTPDATLSTSALIVTGNFTVTALAGNDTVTVDNDDGNRFGGRVTLSLGAGDNTVDVRNSSVAGAFSVTTLGGDDTVSLFYDQFHAGLTVNLGDGTNTTSLTNSIVVGATRVTMGAGEDGVGLNNDWFLGAVTFTLGAGANAVYLAGGVGDVTVLGGLTVTTLGGDDGVFLPYTTIGGALTLNLGAGGNRVELFDSAVGGAATVTGGAGGDEFSADSAQFGAAVTLSLGAGDNEVVLGDSSVAGATVVSALGGNDYVAVDDSTFSSNFTLGLGGGTNTVSIGGADIIGTAAVTAAEGDDTVSLGLTAANRLNKALTLTLGAGANHATVNNSMVLGSTTVTTLGGDDTVNIYGNHMGGSLTENLGAGHNMADLSGDIGGSFSYTGAAGWDEVTLGDRNENDWVNVAGSVTIGTGANEYRVSIANSTILKTLSVTTGLKGALPGDYELAVWWTEVWGNVTINNGDADDNVTLEACTFLRSVTVNTGEGADTVGADCSEFSRRGGSFSLLTGGGADTVNLGTATGWYNATTFWRGVSVDLGAGDDTLLIGKSSNPDPAPGGTGDAYTFVRFESPISQASFTGGTGTNTIHRLLENGTLGLDILNQYRFDPKVLLFSLASINT